MPVKVVHITPSYYPAFAYGGPTRSTYELTRHLAARDDCSVRVLTTNANGREKLDDVSCETPIRLAERLEVFYCNRVGGESVSFELLKQMRSFVADADIVHLTAAYSFPTLPALALSRAAGKPVVWSPRGAFLQWSGTRRVRGKAIWDRVCRALLTSQCVIHVTSDQERDATSKRFAGATVARIPNGVDVPETVIRAPDRSFFNIAFIGRLDPIKGLENLILACAQLEMDRQWRLIIGGRGNAAYEQTLRALADTTGYSQRIVFRGSIAEGEKQRFFSEADVVILPSFSENFGIAAAEALAHGVPVVASSATPWERLDEIGCGLCVPNSPESLARAIEKVALMPGAEAGLRGREWMRSEFSWGQAAERMYAVYESLVGSRRP